ncbi:MAG TPA: patatin-like phospholipase family protein, partial [Candidatus Manganitrophaceae bacterium]|nr:patatin-like phospholipase family protein [Candidatus Manganitrophaceae bacterium]
MGRSFKIGLALGGGGARGLAHLGALKALEAEGFQFDLICGSSFGAMAGAMYAQYPHAEQIIRRVVDFLEGEAFRRTKIFFIKRHYEEKKRTSFIANLKSYLEKGFFWGISLRRESFISEQDFLSQIHVLFEDQKIEEMTIPFSAVATDLVEGKPVILSKGSLRKAIAASCAIPGVFPPITINNSKLIDGGWVSPAPVEPLIRQGADFIIAIDTSEDAGTVRALTSGLDIVLRSGDITRQVLSNTQLEKADLVIRPQIGKIHWSDFWRYEEAIRKGEEAASLKIDELKKLLWKKKMKK